MNFYEQVKNDFASLEKLVRISLYSREAFRDAEAIYARPNLHSPIKRAWAIWLLANIGYSGMLTGTFGYDRSGQGTRRVRNKRGDFVEELAIRLQDVLLEACDALRIIRSRDTPETLFYCDPPYINSDQGHYDGYGEADYQALLDELAQIQGKFVLSSYRSAPLKEAVAKHGWHSIEIDMPKRTAKGRIKTEVLTANYPIVL